MGLECPLNATTFVLVCFSVLAPSTVKAVNFGAFIGHLPVTSFF